MIGHMLGMTPLHWYTNVPGTSVISRCRRSRRFDPACATPAWRYIPAAPIAGVSRARRAPRRAARSAIRSSLHPSVHPARPERSLHSPCSDTCPSTAPPPSNSATYAVTKRHHASLNEDAIFRDPITVDDYLASRWVAKPVRLLDCDYPCDISGAVIFTSEERASSWRKQPIFVEAAAMAGVHTTWEYLDDLLATAQVPCAEHLWSQTDLGPTDVDVAQLYDGFSIVAFGWLEALGFCKPGEAGPFIADGNIRLGGALPMNTDGGVANVGRRHGASHCIETVRQLRGESGVRQVPDAEVGLYTIGHGPFSTSVLLTSS